MPKISPPYGGGPLHPVPGSLILRSTMVCCHLVALLAFVPFFFSWTGVWLAVAGALLSALGVNLCYHRMLAHGGLSCSKRVEHALALLGVMANQFGPAYWVAIHRRHHHFTEDHRDPHSPNRSFYWSHIGWLFEASGNTEQQALMERYAPDLLKDPFYVWLEKDGVWGRFMPVVWIVLYAAGALAAWLRGEPAAEINRFGLSLAVWGAAVRTVVVWHITFAVNSFCHVWGYRNYDTADDSRNNPVFGILSFGEGWHNNHHAFPRSARHGLRWWELDLTWLTIRALAGCRLVKIVDAADPSAVKRGSAQ